MFGLARSVPLIFFGFVFGCSGEPSQPPSSNFTWHESFRADLSGFTYKPLVVLDRSGNALIVWIARDQQTGAQNLTARQFIVAEDLAGPISIIHSAVGADILCYHVFSNDNDVVVVWLQFDFQASTNKIVASRYDSSLSIWERPTELQSTSGTPSCPKVGVDATGNALVLWDVIQTDTVSGVNFTEIYSAYRRIGNAWENAYRLSSEVVGWASLNPQFSTNDNGSAVVVWGAGASRIHTAFFNPSNRWSNAVEIESVSGGYLSGPNVVIDSAGNALALWNHRLQVLGKFYRAGVGWGSTETISPTDDVTRVMLKAAEAGDGLVVWTTYNQGMPAMWARPFSTMTSSFGSVQPLQHPANVYSLDFDIDSAGNALVLWHGIQNFTHYLYATPFTLSNGWQASAAIDPGSSTFSNLSLDVNETGRAAAVWESSAIYANFYH